ncbi:DUF3427 domain-containing protein [Secundilactobacillus similis]|uniref:DUF3427 domain-containing protein n=1 Tax=Secundilactobacillus similis TaxID=414682 RepID=UPI0009EC0083|nr:DUF3427 domain-containing protein [Secundilactobacillus similis]
MGWDEGRSSTVYGYRVHEGICPIFVTYAKSDDIDASINYEDRFISTDIFEWYSRHNVKMTDKEMVQILSGKTTIHLFIKKNDDEGNGFYYFGEVSVADAEQETFQVSEEKVEPIVRVMLRLKEAARYDRYLLFEK